MIWKYFGATTVFLRVSFMRLVAFPLYVLPVVVKGKKTDLVKLKRTLGRISRPKSFIFSLSLIYYLSRLGLLLPLRLMRNSCKNMKK